jgi:pimeloyl-ACP methyl ester carboxylesterase
MTLEMIGVAHETVVDGTSIAWGEMGTGRPLVLLHGLWDSHRTWRRVAPLLARDYRVLMPDLAGSGWSGRPDAPYTLGYHARMMAGWMDAIGVARAHVCGHSYGAGIAAWMLLEQRARIDRLALVAAGGLGREVAPAMRLAAVPLLGPALTPLVLRLAVPLVLRCSPEAFGHMEPAEVALFLRMGRVPGTGQAFQRSVAGVINVFGQYRGVAARVHEIAGLPPLAMFWGTADPIIPARHGTSFLERLRGATLTTYEGCGHFPQLDAAPRFARDLTAFLSDRARPAASLRAAAAPRRARAAATAEYAEDGP